MSRRRGPFVPLFALSLCAALVWLYFTPYLALRKLQAAAESGDTGTLSAMVDFPALRASLRDEVRDAASRTVGGQRPGRAARIGGVVAGAVAGAVADPFVGTLVSPAGVALLLQGRGPGDPRVEGGRWREDVAIERRYEGVNRFAVRYVDREGGHTRVSLLLRREGIAWRLVGVRLGGAS
jgi:hypothetical protein